MSPTSIYTLSLHDALPIFPITARHGQIRHPSITDVFDRTSIHFVAQHARERVSGAGAPPRVTASRLLTRSEEHTSELQSQFHLVCRLLLEKKKPYHYSKIQ